MKWFRREKRAKVPTIEVPWHVEYRLRLLHMPNGQGDCTGCHKSWDDCPTLRIIDEHWGAV